MTIKFGSFISYAFFFGFFSFLAVHYAHMKTPGIARDVASFKETIQPLYNASFKL